MADLCAKRKECDATGGHECGVTSLNLRVVLSAQFCYFSSVQGVIGFNEG